MRRRGRLDACGLAGLVATLLALLGEGSSAAWVDDHSGARTGAGVQSGAAPETGQPSHTYLALAPVGQYGGPTRAVAVEGGRVFLGVGPRLVVLDAADPERPTVMGESPVLPGVVTDVALSGSLAYVTFVSVRADPGSTEQFPKDSGMLVIDVAEPERPRVVGVHRLEAPGQVTGVAISGRYALLAAGQAGLRILDATTPWQVREVAAVDVPGGAAKVRIAGSMAYAVGGESTALWAVDVSNLRTAAPGEPIFVTNSIQDAVVIGRTAYAAGFGHLEILDVSNPRNAQGLGFAFFDMVPAALAVAGDYAYILGQQGGLRIVRVSDPNEPTEVGSLDVPADSAIVVAEDHAYAVAEHGGLRIIDVSDPEVPFEVGTYVVPGRPSTVVVAGEYAYLVDFDTGLRILDISDPAMPTPVGAYSMPAALDVAVAGETAYVAARQFGLRMVDVHDPHRPRELGAFVTENGAGAFGVAVEGNVAYVLESDQRLGGLSVRVLDVSQPGRARDLGMLERDRTGSPRTLAWYGNRLYLGCENGLQLLDTTEPNRPKTLGMYFTPTDSGPVTDVAVSGSHAYLAVNGTDTGLRIIDISEPRNPFEVAVHRGGSAQSVALRDHYAFVGLDTSSSNGTHAGLSALDVTDPGRPRPIAEYTPPSAGSFHDVGPSIALAGRHVLLTDPDGGLYVLRLIEGPRVFLPLSYNGASVSDAESEPTPRTPSGES